jgi:hypothetical protein
MHVPNLLTPKLPQISKKEHKNSLNDIENFIPDHCSWSGYIMKTPEGTANLVFFRKLHHIPFDHWCLFTGPFLRKQHQIDRTTQLSDKHNQLDTTIST